MICGSGGRGPSADELGDGTDDEGAAGVPAAPLAPLEGAGVVADPAKPCTASTIMSGG
jgi:hypothetical protein